LRCVNWCAHMSDIVCFIHTYITPQPQPQLHPALELATGPMAASIRLHSRITRLSTPVFRPATRVQVNP
jgi:hypothetical protein